MDDRAVSAVKSARPIFMNQSEQKQKPRAFAAFPLQRKYPDLLMLVFVDLLAGFILFPVQLLLFALGQVAVVGSHIGLLLILDMLFAIFDARRLAGRHGSVRNAIGDAVLLILLAGIDFVDPRMTWIDNSRTGA